MPYISENSTVLITGGAGFIGSAMVRHLVLERKCRVINIDNLSYSGNLSNLEEISRLNNYHFFKLSIGERDSVHECLQKYKPNVVINFAAESHVDKSIDNPGIFFKTNVLDTLNLLMAVKDYLKNNDLDFLFHHISTDEVYGDIPMNDNPSNEETPYKPSSPYAASKASSDHIVRAFIRTYGFPATISNCSNNYGSFQHPEKLIPHMIINALNNKKLPVYGDGKQIRDWLHVDDHISGILKIIEYGKIGQTYNIGGLNEVTNLEVVNLICQTLDAEFPRQDKVSYKKLISFVGDRPGHDRRYAIDCSKISNDLNWKPSLEFKIGLEQTVKWYLNNQDWWNSIMEDGYSHIRQGL